MFRKCKSKAFLTAASQKLVMLETNISKRNSIQIEKGKKSMFHYFNKGSCTPLLLAVMFHTHVVTSTVTNTPLPVL